MAERTNPPEVQTRSKTPTERAAAAEQARRRSVGYAAAAMAGSRDRIYEHMADSLLTLISDALTRAVASGKFAVELRHHDLAVVPVCTDPPDAPHEWVVEVIELGFDSSPELLEQIEGLWVQAYRAGWEGHAAHTEQPADTEDQP